MRKILLCVVVQLFAVCLLSGQTDSSAVANNDGELKTGWTFGGVPAIAFDSDIGFKYGLVLNFFNYGDGKSYPKYHHNLYFEWSRTTKGSGINQFTYDSEHLIPGIRVTSEFSYMTEQALDFYGFNGYETEFIADYSDDEASNYLSRMYYRMDRKLLRIKSDFQGPITGPKFRWLAGFEFSNIKTGTVDIDKLNKGKDQDEMLPDTALLFDKYITNGLIAADQKDGGSVGLVKLGTVYDTRDNESNSSKGMWTEAQILIAPSFLGSSGLSYTRLAVTHRQYFTLVPQRLTFAYRLSYQGKLSGETPYYMLPFFYNTAPQYTRDGLGGAKTIRGVLRNRVVGDGVALGNLELRWKVLRTVIANQNFYIALSGFLDGGIVTQPYKLDMTALSQTQKDDLGLLSTNESLHIGYGGGIRFALNENFIVAVDMGWPPKKKMVRAGCISD
ncbi:MAG: BamA/TamA family outer membrane protein [Bacteroidales bacterium]